MAAGLRPEVGTSTVKYASCRTPSSRARGVLNDWSSAPVVIEASEPFVNGVRSSVGDVGGADVLASGLVASQSLSAER